VTVRVIDAASRGGDLPLLEMVLLGLLSELSSTYHLENPEPAEKHHQNGDKNDNQRAQPRAQILRSA